MPSPFKDIIIHDPVIDDQDADFKSGMEDISKMSMEQVVTQYYQSEYKRGRKDEPESKAEVQIDADAWPTMVIWSINRFSGKSPARSIACFSKCATYAICAWFIRIGMGDLVLLKDEVDDIISKIPNPWLLKTVAESVAAPTFVSAEVSDKKRAQLSTIGWFYTLMQKKYAPASGMGISQLFGIGMEWFLSTTAQPEIDPTNIESRYKRDAKLLELYIFERKLYFAYLKGVVEARRKLPKEL